METYFLPILVFLVCATLLGIGLLAVGSVLGPKRTGRVKEMPYESGMDPIHDARRRFDFLFHLVAIAFLLFDVELLFLYPWAVARGGFAQAGLNGGLIFGEVMFFIALLLVGYAYAWRKGVFRWR